MMKREAGTIGEAGSAEGAGEVSEEEEVVSMGVSEVGLAGTEEVLEEAAVVSEETEGASEAASGEASKVEADLEVDSMEEGSIEEEETSITGEELALKGNAKKRHLTSTLQGTTVTSDFN
jgi:hypothetical protein